MHAFWSVLAAVSAGAAALLLRGEVFRRSVTSGEALRDACPACSAPVSLPARGVCAACGERVGPRALTVEVPAALAGAAFGYLLGPSVELLGFVALCALGAALAAVDIAVTRLPDRLVGLSFVALLVPFAAGAVVRGDATRLLSGLAGAGVLCAYYLVLALVGRGQLGLGDVKLAAVLGLALGWFGWGALLLGSLAAFLSNAVVTLVLLAAKRITLKSELPFGPFMLLGAALVVTAV